MGAELINGQSLIESFAAFMPASVGKVNATSSAQVEDRSGAVNLGDLPKHLQTFITATIANADLGANPKLARLLQGDMSDYENDHSKADSGCIRLLHENGLSPDECDMVLRATPLMRDKWDSKRGQSTYGAVTIAQAVAVNQVSSNDLRTASLRTEKVPRLNLTDGLLTFSNDLPPPRDFVIQDLLLAGKSALLAGLGGVSKSQLILQMAICAVLGLPFMGRATKECASLILLGEEDSGEVSRRVNAIAKIMRLTAEQLKLVTKRLRVFPRYGLDTYLTRPIAGALESTGLAQGVIEAANELETESGLPVRLIALDHLGLIHGGDFNAREDSVQTMLQVNHIANETGAGVVVLAHSPKASIGKDQVNSADVAGSAGFVDQSRGVYILRTMDDIEGKQFGIDPEQRKNYVSLTNVKANYTRNGDVIWMERRTVEGYEVSVLHNVVMHEPVKEPKGSNNKIRTAIFELLKEKPYLAKDNLLGYAGAKDGRIRGSKAVVSTEVQMMLGEGVLHLVEPTTEERKRLGIKGGTNGFLRITKDAK